MSGTFDPHLRPSEQLLRRISNLERQITDLQTARRLEAASIGRGGLTVKGGAIVIEDADGEEKMRLATDGLTILGVLEVLGQFDFTDNEGFRRVRIRPVAEDAGNISYRSGPSAQQEGEVVIGTIFVGEAKDVSHGLLVQTEGGEDLLRAWSGEFDQVMLRDGTNVVLNATPGEDQKVDLRDAAGNLRAVVGPLTWSGADDGYGLLLQLADGTDRLFVSDNRIWLRTTDGQVGEVTAGDADSGGTGFRVLRIPN